MLSSLHVPASSRNRIRLVISTNPGYEKQSSETHPHCSLHTNLFPTITEQEAAYLNHLLELQDGAVDGRRIGERLPGVSSDGSGSVSEPGQHCPPV